MHALGKHYLIEYYNCDPQVLNHQTSIQEILLEAARLSGATVLEHSFHKFSPQGVSGVVVIAESHISIHTWPEYRYAAADIFTCGTNVDAGKAYAYMKQLLSSEKSFIREIDRGELKDTGNAIQKGNISLAK